MDQKGFNYPLADSATENSLQLEYSFDDLALQVVGTEGIDPTRTLHLLPENGSNGKAKKRRKKPTEPELKEEGMPEGRFWKTIKSDTKTLYQCPFEDCGKSKIFFLLI